MAGWPASSTRFARIHGPVQEYLTDPARMKRFYSAIRGKVTSPVRRARYSAPMRI